MPRHVFTVLGVLAIFLSGSSRAEVLDVAAFLAHPPDPGPVTIAAYATSIYACPPCPEGAQCKPCIGDHILTSDSPGPVVTGGLMIFCERAKSSEFTPSRRYRFDADPRTVRQKDPFVGDIHLRAAQLLTQP
ncbi:MAG: hypothetical protein EXR07_20780 [Acetobacteraceae bacterium]|nr:hypothetical protein [Acetobacteraceae bacterium]